jgi:hypothetical protein
LLLKSSNLVLFRNMSGEKKTARGSEFYVRFFLEKVKVALFLTFFFGRHTICIFPLFC